MSSFRALKTVRRLGYYSLDTDGIIASAIIGQEEDRLLLSRIESSGYCDLAGFFNIVERGVCGWSKQVDSLEVLHRQLFRLSTIS